MLFDVYFRSHYSNDIRLRFGCVLSHTHTDKRTSGGLTKYVCVHECEFLFRINLSLDSLPAPTNQHTHTHTHTLTHICTCFRHVDTIECACECVMCVRRWWVMCVCVCLGWWCDMTRAILSSMTPIPCDSHTIWLAGRWLAASITFVLLCARRITHDEHGFCVCVRVLCVNKCSIECTFFET